MSVLLVTACGCERVLNADPPASEIVVPISPSFKKRRTFRRCATGTRDAQGRRIFREVFR